MSNKDSCILPSPSWRPLSRVPLYQQVVGQLYELISLGELQPGQRLPNEGNLALEFGVSRTVIREAIKTLRERGVLEVSPGRGMVVTRPSDAFLVEAVSSLFQEFGDVTVENFLEMRELLEVRIARLAAERAAAEDIQLLAKVLDEGYLGEHRFRANFGFHVALARATHNPLFVTLLQILTKRTGQISESIYEKLPGVRERVHCFHNEIFEHVHNHDTLAAEDAARRHMGDVRRNYVALLGEDGLRSLPSRQEVHTRERDGICETSSSSR